MATTIQSIIKLTFKQPINGKTEYYFGSIKAMFELFTPEQLGCTLRDIYDFRIRDTSLCKISKHKLYRKKNKN